MTLLFARQPILEISNKLYGYEFLCREEGGGNSYSSVNGDVATSNVMAASFLSMGVNEILGKRKAFINFTEAMLLHGVATLFPKEQIVIEVLENVEPSADIIVACKNLKAEGYTLALDDFVFTPSYEALINLADIIKVDFMATKTDQDRNYVVRQLRNGKIKFLAEKIENYDDFQIAVKAGYTLFQGYYFSKPVITSSKRIPPSKMNHIALIKLLESKDPDFEDIAKIIEKDVAFSYEILRIANTAYYYRGSEIVSIRQAAIRIGLDELKKWAFITALRKIGGNGQDMIVNLCAQRAKTLELLCRKLGLNKREMEFFTLGILSMIDVLAGCPIELLLPELPVSSEVKQVLSGNYDQGKMSVCYKVILAYEKGEWAKIFDYVHKHAINVADVAEAYAGAVVWVNNVELD
ncbi:HDOD domain-containing protein [Desulfosporosinus sp. PR]|uniref:EAL and HDOD domain-containing protein n=1 Tax=Candidatus Desulfosporosinus nitrosoreducens TaxID=3401928 RepID=UPI0027F9EE51|nr:HDOD domain-containing protein [Desulfosporosinus sp. PR]MDQ7094829.1 HDOD domain-containing protein [Desulfosporosinus sp. PR]